MEYNFRAIEEKWQKKWQESQIYKVDIDESKPKFYVLDMFPYPSGAGLHVGHPLGYIASDIYSRYKRLKGFNVLHPMGYDAFGLPAEQYAIQTGQHPAKTTEINAKRYREQLDKIGFSYDWSREFKTSDPDYYKWTQWVFIQMFNHYYCNQAQQARPITELVEAFNTRGTEGLDLVQTEELNFTAKEWKTKTEKEQQEILLNYRLAYLAETFVNWCPALGTVLANDEVTNGVSVRGGHPVEQKKMLQWSLRVSAYASRLLDDMEELEWTDALKEIQKNWIGKSVGAQLQFKIQNSKFKIEVFTTRPDTLYGVTFMVLAPESDYVAQLTSEEQKTEVEAYIKATQKRSERDRMSDVKTVTGVFSGTYAIHPLTGKEIPIWIADYVLAGYGTGAVMAVPAHDSRDFAFAKKFNLPIVQVVAKKDEELIDTKDWTESYDAKEGIIINSEGINGLTVKKAMKQIIYELEQKGIGEKQTNYRLRDAIFSRQRYWGEPFPIYYKDDMPYTLDESKLPLELPEVDKFLPTEDGQPPLGRAENWQTEEGYPLELSTMPGFAGSSAYYLRYMDPKNDKALVSKEANEYWQDVDLYIGGTEHATGHLIYSRFWNKFLFDLGLVTKNEPFKKLINQGMIQGVSGIAKKILFDASESSWLILPKEAKEKNEKLPLIIKDRIPIKYLDIVDENYILTKENLEKLKKEHPYFQKYRIGNIEEIRKTPENKELDFDSIENNINADFVTIESVVEKMSKSFHNVINPDEIIKDYGADTLRMYEMFLGPLEQAKPWSEQGIDGVFKFFRKLWNLFYDAEGNLKVSDEQANKDELKILHKTIKKIQDDIEHFSFNTSVSAFMIFVNDIQKLKSSKREILEPFLILLSSFAPHISEELWSAMGHTDSIINAQFPEFNAEYLKESDYEYPVSFNGKMRFKLKLSLDITDAKKVEELVKNHEQAQKWLEGKQVRKVIFVPKKIINIVVG